MDKEMLKIGESLVEMGQKIIDMHKGKEEEVEDGVEEEGETEEGSEMPKKALIIASLKRKIK